MPLVGFRLAGEGDRVFSSLLVKRLNPVSPTQRQSFFAATSSLLLNNITTTVLYDRVSGTSVEYTLGIGIITRFNSRTDELYANIRIEKLHLG